MQNALNAFSGHNQITQGSKSQKGIQPNFFLPPEKDVMPLAAQV
jgi:hypothetical protein